MPTMKNSTAIGLDPNAAVRRIFQDPELRPKALLGAILNFSAFLTITAGSFAVPLLPLTFLLWAAMQGYLLRVLRTELKVPNSPLPSWNDPLELLISGLTWLAVMTGQFMALASIITISFVIGIQFGYINAFNPHFKQWYFLSVIAFGSASFLTSFFFPLLMANFAEQEKVLAAIAVDDAMQRVWRRPLEFLTVWLLNIGIFWLSVVVPIFTIVGAFLLPMVLFCASLISVTMLAQVWRAAAADR